MYCKNLNLSKLKKIKKIEKFQKDNRKKHVETMFIANKQKNYVKIIFQKEIIDASIINFMIKYEWMSTKPFKYFYLLRKND